MNLFRVFLVIGLFVCSARPCAAATLTSYTSKEGKVVVIGHLEKYPLMV